jgi:hypothetical protein
MKDAKGHGSEKRGGAAHETGVQNVGRPAPKISDAALNVIRNTPPGGGGSVTPGGQQPTAGYMVSLPSRTKELEVGELQGPNARAILNAYAQTHADVFSNPAMHFGLWHDPDTKKMSLDPSENIMSRKAAIAAGVARNQKEIWDVKRGVGIKTGGTGT